MNIKNFLFFTAALFSLPLTGMAKETQPTDKAQEEITVYPEMNDIVIGSDEAPVTLVEYSSINCVHCAHFHTKAFKDLKKKYIDTKKVKVVFKHFSLDYQAVEYMSLIVKQPENKWMSMLDVAFERQNDWLGQPPEKLAEILGISAEDCKAARSCDHTKELIMAKRFNAEQVIDIDATPVFQIFFKSRGVEKNIRLKDGIAPKDLYEKIDAVLEAADKT